LNEPIVAASAVNGLGQMFGNSAGLRTAQHRDRQTRSIVR
jgi:hypothetical protein